MVPAPQEHAPTPLPRIRDERVHLTAEFHTAIMVARRELVRFTRARGRVFSSFVQPLVFLFILGYGLSQLVETAGEVSFVQFLVPGVVAMIVVFTSVSCGASVVWDREFGFLREMLVGPPRAATLVLGKVTGGALIATMQGTLLLLLSPIVGITLSPFRLLAVIGIASLTATALTAFVVFLASSIHKIETFQSVIQIIMMPMIFLSGAIFPLRDLPPWLTILTHLNPLTYAIDPMRQVMFSGQNMDPSALNRFSPGISVFGQMLPIVVELAIISVFALSFIGLSARRFGAIK